MSSARWYIINAPDTAEALSAAEKFLFEAEVAADCSIRGGVVAVAFPPSDDLAQLVEDLKEEVGTECTISAAPSAKLADGVCIPPEVELVDLLESSDINAQTFLHGDAKRVYATSKQDAALIAKLLATRHDEAEQARKAAEREAAAAELAAAAAESGTAVVVAGEGSGDGAADANDDDDGASSASRIDHYVVFATPMSKSFSEAAVQDATEHLFVSKGARDFGFVGDVIAAVDDDGTIAIRGRFSSETGAQGFIASLAHTTHRKRFDGQLIPISVNERNPRYLRERTDRIEAITNGAADGETCPMPDGCFGEGRHLVTVVGPTQAGKSTTICLALGRHMRKHTGSHQNVAIVGDNPLKGAQYQDRYLVVKKLPDSDASFDQIPTYALVKREEWPHGTALKMDSRLVYQEHIKAVPAQHFVAMKPAAAADALEVAVENLGKSTTVDMYPYDAGNQLILLDTPGTHDTRGIQVDIRNAVARYRLARKTAGGLPMCIVVDCSRVDSTAGRGLDEYLAPLADCFVDYEKSIQKVSILFTRYAKAAVLEDNDKSNHVTDLATWINTFAGTIRSQTQPDSPALRNDIVRPFLLYALAELQKTVAYMLSQGSGANGPGRATIVHPFVQVGRDGQAPYATELLNRVITNAEPIQVDELRPALGPIGDDTLGRSLLNRQREFTRAMRDGQGVHAMFLAGEMCDALERLSHVVVNADEAPAEPEYAQMYISKRAGIAEVEEEMRQQLHQQRLAAETRLRSHLASGDVTQVTQALHELRLQDDELESGIKGLSEAGRKRFHHRIACGGGEIGKARLFAGDVARTAGDQVFGDSRLAAEVRDALSAGAEGDAVALLQTVVTACGPVMRLRQLRNIVHGGTDFVTAQLEALAQRYEEGAAATRELVPKAGLSFNPLAMRRALEQLEAASAALRAVAREPSEPALRLSVDDIGTARSRVLSCVLDGLVALRDNILNCVRGTDKGGDDVPSAESIRGAATALLRAADDPDVAAALDQAFRALLERDLLEHQDLRSLLSTEISLLIASLKKGVLDDLNVKPADMIGSVREGLQRKYKALAIFADAKEDEAQSTRAAIATRIEDAAKHFAEQVTKAAEATLKQAIGASRAGLGSHRDPLAAAEVFALAAEDSSDAREPSRALSRGLACVLLARDWEAASGKGEVAESVLAIGVASAQSISKLLSKVRNLVSSSTGRGRLWNASCALAFLHWAGAALTPTTSIRDANESDKAVLQPVYEKIDVLRKEVSDMRSGVQDEVQHQIVESFTVDDGQAAVTSTFPFEQVVSQLTQLGDIMHENAGHMEVLLGEGALTSVKDKQQSLRDAAIARHTLVSNQLGAHRKALEYDKVFELMLDECVAMESSGILNYTRRPSLTVSHFPADVTAACNLATKRVTADTEEMLRRAESVLQHAQLHVITGDLGANLKNYCERVGDAATELAKQLEKRRDAFKTQLDSDEVTGNLVQLERQLQALGDDNQDVISMAEYRFNDVFFSRSKVLLRSILKHGSSETDLAEDLRQNVRRALTVAKLLDRHAERERERERDNAGDPAAAEVPRAASDVLADDTRESRLRRGLKDVIDATVRKTKTLIESKAYGATVNPINGLAIALEALEILDGLCEDGDELKNLLLAKLREACDALVDDTTNLLTGDAAVMERHLESARRLAQDVDGWCGAIEDMVSPTRKLRAAIELTEVDLAQRTATTEAAQRIFTETVAALRGLRPGEQATAQALADVLEQVPTWSTTGRDASPAAKHVLSTARLHLDSIPESGAASLQSDTHEHLLLLQLIATTTQSAAPGSDLASRLVELLSTAVTRLQAVLPALSAPAPDDFSTLPQTLAAIESIDRFKDTKVGAIASQEADARRAALDQILNGAINGLRAPLTDDMLADNARKLAIAAGWADAATFASNRLSSPAVRIPGNTVAQVKQAISQSVFAFDPQTATNATAERVSLALQAVGHLMSADVRTTAEAHRSALREREQKAALKNKWVGETLTRFVAAPETTNVLDRVIVEFADQQVSDTVLESCRRVAAAGIALAESNTAADLTKACKIAINLGKATSMVGAEGPFQQLAAKLKERVLALAKVAKGATVAELTAVAAALGAIKANTAALPVPGTETHDAAVHAITAEAAARANAVEELAARSDPSQLSRVQVSKLDDASEALVLLTGGHGELLSSWAGSRDQFDNKIDEMRDSVKRFAESDDFEAVGQLLARATCDSIVLEVCLEIVGNHISKVLDDVSKNVYGDSSVSFGKLAAIIALRADVSGPPTGLTALNQRLEPLFDDAATRLGDLQGSILTSFGADVNAIHRPARVTGMDGIVRVIRTYCALPHTLATQYAETLAAIVRDARDDGKQIVETSLAGLADPRSKSADDINFHETVTAAKALDRLFENARFATMLKDDLGVTRPSGVSLQDLSAAVKEFGDVGVAAALQQVNLVDDQQARRDEAEQVYVRLLRWASELKPLQPDVGAAAVTVFNRVSKMVEDSVADASKWICDLFVRSLDDPHVANSLDKSVHAVRQIVRAAGSAVPALTSTLDQFIAEAEDRVVAIVTSGVQEVVEQLRTGSDEEAEQLCVTVTRFTRVPSLKEKVRGAIDTITMTCMGRLGRDVQATFFNSIKRQQENGQLVKELSIFKQLTDADANHDMDVVTPELALKDKVTFKPELKRAERVELQRQLEYSMQEVFKAQLQRAGDTKAKHGLQASLDEVLDTVLAAAAAASSGLRTDLVALISCVSFAFSWFFSGASFDGAMKDAAGRLRKPHAIQMTSIMRALEIEKTVDNSRVISKLAQLAQSSTGQFEGSHMIEVPTGQGKSITLGILAAVLALLGRHVDVVCYSQQLTDRDYETLLPLYKFLGIDSRISYLTFQGVMERRAGGVREAMLAAVGAPDSSITASEPDSCPERRVLLIDEVDVLFDPAFFGRFYVPTARLVKPCVTELLEFIYQNRGDDGILSKINSTHVKVKAACDESPDLRAYIVQEVGKMLDQVRDFGKSTTAQNPERPDDYVVDRDKGIGYYDSDGTISFAKAPRGWYRPAFALIHERAKGTVDGDANRRVSLPLSCPGFSYANLCRSQYCATFGVTGTLSTLTEEHISVLRRQCGVNKLTFTKPVYPETRKTWLDGNTMVADVKPTRADTDEEWFRTIDAAIKVNRKDQGDEDGSKGLTLPIVVIFESATMIQRFLSVCEQYRDCNVIDRNLPAQRVEELVDAAASENTITLVDRMFGRGTDFKCKRVTRLTIIQTFLPTTESEEVQIRGRTARQGTQGAVKVVLNPYQVVDALQPVEGQELEELTVEAITVTATTVDDRGFMYIVRRRSIDACGIKNRAGDLGAHAVADKFASDFVKQITASELSAQAKFDLVLDTCKVTDKHISKPPAYLLILDASGSMGFNKEAASRGQTLFYHRQTAEQKEDTPWNDLQCATRETLAIIQRQHEAYVIVLLFGHADRSGHQFRLVCSDRAADISPSILDSLEPEFGTEYYIAFHRAAEAVRNAADAIRGHALNVLFMTDGADMPKANRRVSNAVEELWDAHEVSSYYYVLFGDAATENNSITAINSTFERRGLRKGPEKRSAANPAELTDALVSITTEGNEDLH